MRRVRQITSAYREGLKKGVEAYAVWNDGKQMCGVLRTPLQEVYDQIDRGDFTY